MGELDLFEVDWLRAHSDELLGLLESEAIEAVRAAGFHPTVLRLGRATAYAGTGGEGKILLISIDGRIRGSRPA